MTDKEQIMIDSVDVSKCEWFKDGMCYAECDLEGYTNWECEDTELSNCYFKQLARKTQEYNELLEQYKELDDRANRMIEEKYNLAREYEALKSERFTRESLISIQEEDIDRYRKALDEIEEYCHKQISFTGDLPFRTTESDILDIINKTKGE